MVCSWILTVFFLAAMSLLRTERLSFAKSSMTLYMPSPRRFERTPTRSSLPASKNNPYWSCIISTHALNVRLSIPRTFSISFCVSLYFSLDRSSHSPLISCDKLSVPFPDFALVRTTRNVFSPRENVKLIEPDLAFSSLRIQPVRSPSLGSSNRQSIMASIKRLLFPAPFCPLIVQNRISSNEKLCST